MKYDCLSGNYEPTYKEFYRMKKSLVIVIVLVAGYLFVSNITEWFSHPILQETKGLTKQERYEYFNTMPYEKHVTYDVEYAQYIKLKFQVYSVMFFLSFLYIFFNSNRLVKAISAFAVFISFASVIDKVFFNFYQFKATDWIVIAAGILGSLYVHIKARD